MSETTKTDMIIIMHRLKRLIGSSYQKRIDIIITVNDFVGVSIVSDSNGANGFLRLNLATVLRATQANTKIRVFTNNNVAGFMREKGIMFINRLS